MVLGKLGRYVQKNETIPSSYTTHKNKFKMDQRPKDRPKIIKILDKNIGSKLSDNVHSNMLLDISPQAGETKEKINKWDFIKLKSFCTAKENINKTKDNPQNGRTYSSIHLIRG